LFGIMPFKARLFYWSGGYGRARFDRILLIPEGKPDAVAVMRPGKPVRGLRSP
jgi:hypothetical protein